MTTSLEAKQSAITKDTTDKMQDSLEKLAAIARSAGIELSVEEATAWLAASSQMAANPGEFDVIPRDGIAGFELAVLDFDPASAARLRHIGDLIATRSRPSVQVGLAIAGSAAQSRIQSFPADNDFFERVHIRAATIGEARAILAGIVRADTLSAVKNRGVVLDDLCFGSGGGKALRWKEDTLTTGSISNSQDDGATAVSWLDAAQDPGFIKVAWILVDPDLGGPGLASKVIDATWEDLNGEIATLDSMIDGEFQQIYLDGSGAELASKVAKSVSRFGPCEIRFRPRGADRLLLLRRRV